MATKENRPMTEEINLTNSPGRISEKEVKALETKKLILISQIEANKQFCSDYRGHTARKDYFFSALSIRIS